MRLRNRNGVALCKRAAQARTRERGRMHPACGIDPEWRFASAIHRAGGFKPPPPDMAPRRKPLHAAPRFAVFSTRHAGAKRLSHSGNFHRFKPCALHAQSPRMRLPQWLCFGWPDSKVGEPSEGCFKCERARLHAITVKCHENPSSFIIPYRFHHRVARSKLFLLWHQIGLKTGENILED